MKRWIVGCVLVGMVAGCSVWDNTWGLGRETGVVQPPTVATAAIDVAPEAAPEAAPPKTPNRSDPHDGYQLTGQAMVVEATALTVNDQVITVSEILHSVHRPLTDAGRGATLEGFKAKAVEIIGKEIQRQIGEALLVERANAELKEQHMEYVDHLVDQRIGEMVLSYGGSQTKLEQQLAADGVTLDDARNTLRRRILSQIYIQLQMGDQAKASRRQLWRYYQDNREQFSRPPKVQMQILAFPFKALVDESVTTITPAHLEAATAEAVTQSAAALERIRAGEDFAAVVTDVSVTSAYRSARGGVWDAMAAGSFRESAVEAAAFGMDAGQVSDVIVGETAAFVVKTLARTEAEVLLFEQAQEQIEKVLLDEQHQQMNRQYDEQLRKRAVIVQAESFSRLAMERAIGLYHTGAGHAH